MFEYFLHSGQVKTNTLGNLQEQLQFIASKSLEDQNFSLYLAINLNVLSVNGITM